MKWILVLSLLLFTLPVVAKKNTEDKTAVRRFAIFVGANGGGAGKPRLKFATSDALAMAKVMGELGGVDAADRFVLLNPRRDEMIQHFEEMRLRVAAVEARDVRTELLFYYSGHSDEDGLLLGQDRFPYTTLRKQILALSAEVSMIILDSCASGNLTRLKGGKPAPPFLMNSLSKLKGYVALTSSSNNEAAQESDRIRGSYFTHFFVSGLRGAADLTANNRITLNEAYQYAYNETLARTERTAAGPQHPSYSIQLSGSGELVMTDLRSTSARILLDKEIAGRIVVRDSSDSIVAEIEKSGTRTTSIALEPGNYQVVWSRMGKFARSTYKVLADQSAIAKVGDFASFEPEVTVTRGENARGSRDWRLGAAGMNANPIASRSANLLGVVATVEKEFSWRFSAAFSTGVHGGYLRGPLIYFNLEAAFHPTAKLAEGPFEAQLLAGFSSVAWGNACSEIVGAVCGTEEIVSTGHVGARALYHFGEELAVALTARLNSVLILLEAGIFIPL